MVQVSMFSQFMQSVRNYIPSRNIYESLSEKMLEKIRSKIESTKDKDMRNGGVTTITVDDVLRKLKDQNYKCFVCKDNFVTHSWGYKCHYQFTMDRIDDNKFHTSDNVVMNCFFCNCCYTRDFPKIKTRCFGKCECSKTITAEEVQEIRKNLGMGYYDVQYPRRV